MTVSDKFTQPNFPFDKHFERVMVQNLELFLTRFRSTTNSNEQIGLLGIRQ